MEKFNTQLQTKSQKRSFEIYSLLAQGKSYKAQELAEKFGCSRKTISNDLKPLVEDGVVKYKAHHYTMLKKYAKEYKQQSSGILNTMMQSMFEKVMPKRVESKNTLFYFDFEIEEIEDETSFLEIMLALSKKIALSFEYTTRGAKKSHKTVYPLKISNFSGVWYLLAYDLEKEEIRTYHLLNINNPKPHKDDYLDTALRISLEDEAQKIDSPWYGNPKKSVTLHAKDLAILYLKRQRHHNVKILQEKEDILVVEFSYYQDTEVLNFVKSWLPFIKIIDSISLEKQLKELMQEYLYTLK